MGRHSQKEKPFRHLLWQVGLATAVIAGALGTSGAVAIHASSLPAGQPVPETTAQTITDTNPVAQASGEYGFEKVSAKVLDESPKTEKTDTTSTVSSEPPQTTTRANTGGASASSAQYSLAALRRAGVVHWGGYKFTYYSQKVLPGGGLRIPGRHVNANGYVADADGYIVLANDAPKGTVINTPFGGPGKVYDRGTRGNHFDVYTS